MGGEALLNRGEEDYLKGMYKLQGVFEEEVFIKTKELMTLFGHSLPSVNEMVKRLQEEGFVSYKPYVGVSLTKKGFLQGEKLIKKHRLWELFLTASLGLSSEEVHEEAEKLEHATSDRVLEALDAFLNYPENCPHGQPIPQNTSD